MYIFLSILVFLLFIFILFIVFLSFSISKLENKIRRSFLKRWNLVPSIFEVSKNYLFKHEEVFSNLLKLRKLEAFYNFCKTDILEIVYIESIIHSELNFIFNVCNKHNKLITNNKFIYIRSLIYENTLYLSKKISDYKRIVYIYNKFIKIKNLTFVGLFIPIDYKDEI